jgi:hypothetical protein
VLAADGAIKCTRIALEFWRSRLDTRALADLTDVFSSIGGYNSPAH